MIRLRLYQLQRWFHLLILFCYLNHDDQVIAQIKQIQIIHRHGARFPLYKHPFDPQIEHRTGTLLKAGKEQLLRLGTWVREEYIKSDATNRIDGINTSPNAIGDIKAYSSNFERTQLSSRSFLKGVYPDNHDDADVATMVFNGSETDWILRGYAICPELGNRFEQFTKEKEYKEKKKKEGAFVSKLAEKLGSKDNATFKHVFDVYDRYNIIDSDYDEVEFDHKVDKISEEDMKRLKEVADWYESHKFAYGTHEIHLAGGLWSRILREADELNNKIVVYSAHYPTLLTLLASMRQDDDGKQIEWPADRIPEFGSALIIEVHGEGRKTIKMKWFQGGDEDVNVKALAVGRGGCKDAEKGCDKSQLDRLMAFQTFGITKFCTDCRSTSGLCMDLIRDGRYDIPCSNTSGDSDVCQHNRFTVGIIGAAVGLLVGLMIALLYMVCTAQRKRKRMRNASLEDGHVSFGNISA